MMASSQSARCTRRREPAAPAGLLLFVVAIVVAVTLLSMAKIGGANSQRVATSTIAQVWTEPQAGYGFLQGALNGARRSIDMSMYELSDAAIEGELITKAIEGVTVRVLLDAAYYGKSDNAQALKELRNSPVHVEWAPTGQIFHAKYLVVDNRRAYVGSGNLYSLDYPTTRDFWVEDTTPGDVAAIEATFAADFARQGSAPRASGGLVWSPGSTSALVALISSARHTLAVENEEMESVPIEQALIAAARRGVEVKVVMTYDPSWNAALAQLASAGVQVRLHGSSQLYIHAKVICVDCTRRSGEVFVGSENFSTSSLSYNRELGVVTRTPNAVIAVMNAFDADYAVGSAVS